MRSSGEMCTLAAGLPWGSSVSTKRFSPSTRLAYNPTAKSSSLNLLNRRPFGNEPVVRLRTELPERGGENAGGITGSAIVLDSGVGGRKIRGGFGVGGGDGFEAFVAGDGSVVLDAFLSGLQAVGGELFGELGSEAGVTS